MDISKRVLSFGAVYLQFEKTGFPPLAAVRNGAEIVGEDYQVVPAGSAVTFALVCSSLGLQPAFIGKIGTEGLGDLVERQMHARGIDTVLLRDADHKTGIVNVNLCADGQSYRDVNPGANTYLSRDDVDAVFDERIQNTSYLYLGGCFKMKSFMPAYESYIRKAHDRGVKVLLNHGKITASVPPEHIRLMKDLIRRVDVYISNKEEFLTMTESETLEEAFKKSEAFSGESVVTDDVHGAYALDRGKIVHMPAFPVTVVNPVTAGDSFNAGFIKARTDGLGTEETLRYANAVAAVKISQIGIPTPEMVAGAMKGER